MREILESWGFIVHIPNNLFGTDLLCANSDEQRFLQLKDALYNPHSQAVWAARGGYGCTRLLSALAKLTPHPQPKLFMGFSDATALHIFLQQQWGWQTLHSPGAIQLLPEKIDPKDIETVKNILQDNKKNLTFNLQPLNKIVPSGIQSTITGGNLCIVQNSIGTFWQIDTRNKILFLEEVNERGYQIDRILEHMRQAGLFENIHALLLGDFLKGEEPDGTSLVMPVLQRFADTCSFPVFHCPGIGHGFRNQPLPLGTPAVLKLNTLTVKGPHM